MSDPLGGEYSNAAEPIWEFCSQTVPHPAGEEGRDDLWDDVAVFRALLH